MERAVKRPRRIAEWALRLFFAVILAWASVDKLLHPYLFSLDVQNYRVAGEGLSNLAAVWVPMLELLLACCLAAGLWLDAAAILNACLMTGFLGLVLQAFFRRLDIHCGCFTVRGESVIGPLKIAENTVFAALAAALVWLVFTRRAGKRDAGNKG
jgi:putative oxidoreductase